MALYRRGTPPINDTSQPEYLRQELQKLEATITAIYKTMTILKQELNDQAVTVTTANA